VTLEIDIPRGAAGANSLTDLNLFASTVVIVNDDVPELDCGAIDLELKGIKPSFRLPDFNLVVVGSSVDVGFTKIDPALGRRHGG
jgi:hypothetical protein